MWRMNKWSRMDVENERMEWMWKTTIRFLLPFAKKKNLEKHSYCVFLFCMMVM